MTAKPSYISKYIEMRIYFDDLEPSEVIELGEEIKDTISDEYPNATDITYEIKDKDGNAIQRPIS